MLSQNQQIVHSAMLAARGRLAVPDRPGMCLAFVRIVVEHALWGGRWMLYEKYLTARTSMPRAKNTRGELDWTPYASDFEASMKRLNLGVPKSERLPGDIICNWDAARPYGHIGILIDKNLVIENINHRFRPTSLLLHPHMAITPLEDFKWSTIARL